MTLYYSILCTCGARALSSAALGFRLPMLHLLPCHLLFARTLYIRICTTQCVAGPRGGPREESRAHGLHLCRLDSLADRRVPRGVVDGDARGDTAQQHQSVWPAYTSLIPIIAEYKFILCNLQLNRSALLCVEHLKFLLTARGSVFIAIRISSSRL